MMVTGDVAKYHIVEALRAGVAELTGDKELAHNLRAETKMRLISMSEEELWELARVTCPPHKTFEQVYAGFKESIDKLKISANEWMKDLENYDSVRGKKGDKRSPESLKE